MQRPLVQKAVNDGFLSTDIGAAVEFPRWTQTDDRQVPLFVQLIRWISTDMFVYLRPYPVDTPSLDPLCGPQAKESMFFVLYDIVHTPDIRIVRARRYD